MSIVAISPLLPLRSLQVIICSDVTVPYPKAQRCENVLLVSWPALTPIRARRRAVRIVLPQSILQISHLYSLEVSFSVL